MQVYKSGKTRIGVMIMLLTGIAIAGIASMLPANTSAQQQRAETALSIASCPPKLIKDTPPGHDVGWDPDGTNDRFLINDRLLPCQRLDCACKYKRWRLCSFSMQCRLDLF